MNVPKDQAAAVQTLDFARLEALAKWRREGLRDSLEKALTEADTQRLRGELAAWKDILTLRDDVKKSLESSN